MPRRLVVRINGALIGEPTHGVWCPRCLLPSAVSFTLAVDVDGHPFDLLDHTACPDCGWEDE